MCQARLKPIVARLPVNQRSLEAVIGKGSFDNNKKQNDKVAGDRHFQYAEAKSREPDNFFHDKKHKSRHGSDPITTA